MGTSQRPELLGRVLSGRYRLVRALGDGPYAPTYLADDLDASRPVVVTFLAGAPGAEVAGRRLPVEARAASDLAHPHIVDLLDWGDDGGPYLVTEVLGGGSLRAMLAAGRRASVSQAVAAGRQVALALDAGHRRGFVHRDLRPEQLLADEEGRVKVASFGLAELLGEAAGVPVPRRPYAAPEQQPGRRVDARVDVYALAVVVLELVTGTAPEPGSLPVLPPGLGRLRAVLERCLRPDPAGRPGAGELARSFEQLSLDLEPPPRLPIVGALVGGGFLGGAVPGSRWRPRGGSAEPATDPRPRPPVVPAPPEDPTVVVAQPDPEPIRSFTPPLEPRGFGEGDLRTPYGADAPWSSGAVTGDPTIPSPATRADGTDARLAALLDEPADPLVGSDRWGATSGEGASVAGAAWSPSRRSVGPAARARWDELRRRLPDADELRRRLPDPAELRRRLPDPAALRNRLPAAAGMRQRLPAVPPTVVLVALLLLIIGGALVYTATRAPTAAVPALTGLDEHEARVLLAQAGAEADVRWEVRVEPEQTTEHPAGMVIGQEPGSGRALADGGVVTLAVSEGPPVGPLPDLVGRPEQEVVAELEAAGYDVRTASRVHDEERPLGAVVGWSVEGEEGVREAPRGSEVALVVSNGPPPREVPSLAGRGADEARAALEELGLAVAVVQQPSADVPAGVVAETQPTGGTLVDRGTEVTLVVSDGPPAPAPGFGDRGDRGDRGGRGGDGVVTVPDVRGQRLRQAARALRAAGLDVGGTSGAWFGRVQGTDPGPGAQVPAGTQVELRIG